MPPEGGRRAPAATGPRAQLVPEAAQQLLALGLVLVGLDPRRRRAVDHAEHAPALFGLAHHDLERVRGRAEDAAHLGHGLDRVQDVDREPVAQGDDEQVTGADRPRVANRDVDELVVVAASAHEPRPARLVERDPELQPRDVHARLVQILDRLDEVGLTDDDVQVLGLVERDDADVHRRTLLVVGRPRGTGSSDPFEPGE